MRRHRPRSAAAEGWTVTVDRPGTSRRKNLFGCREVQNTRAEGQHHKVTRCGVLPVPPSIPARLHPSGPARRIPTRCRASPGKGAAGAPAGRRPCSSARARTGEPPAGFRRVIGDGYWTLVGHGRAATRESAVKSKEYRASLATLPPCKGGEPPVTVIEGVMALSAAAIAEMPKPCGKARHVTRTANLTYLPPASAFGSVFHLGNWHRAL